MKPPIQQLAEKVKEAKVGERLEAHHTLREYVHSLTNGKFQEEVSRVTDKKIFGVLFSVGLNRERQRACYAREGEL